MIGIIGAMQEELAQLLERLEQPSKQTYGGYELHVGKIENHPVILAQCGIGKVNAAALTQLLISQGVTKVIFTGVAGGVAPGLAVGDIVISADCVQHDVDVRPLGYRLGEVPGESYAWPADEALRTLAHTAAQRLSGVQVVVGRVASGDQFLDSQEKAQWLHQTFDALCVEMEGAAVAQICTKAHIPFIIIRSISDSGDESSQMDFREFTPLAAQRAKQVVLGMLRDLT